MTYARSTAMSTEAQQMSLGSFISLLEQVSKPEKLVVFDFGDVPAGETQLFDCYDAHPKELAISHRRPDDPRMTSAGTIVERATEAVGCSFIDDTGNEHKMDADTPLWVANWRRSTGNAVIGLEEAPSKVIIRTWKIE